MPQISVIIPVYKAESFLKRCVDSVLHQTYSDFELILIDDGSPDNSGRICDEYCKVDCRVRVIHKKNAGVSAARNDGIRFARGMWITFIDSDDWVDACYLENFCSNELENEKIIVVQGIRHYFEKKGVVSDLFKYDTCCFDAGSIDEIRRVDLLKDGCPVAKLFNRNVILKNDIFFNTQVSLNEDHIFVVDYYRCVDEIFLKDYIGYNYFVDFSLTSLTRKRHSVSEYLIASESIYEKYKQLCKVHRLDEELVLSNFSKKIFGYQQIIRAMKASFFCVESYELFVKCSDAWRKKRFVEVRTDCLYEKCVTCLLQKNMVFVAFLFNCYCCAFFSLRDALKLFLKRFYYGYFK